MPKQTPLEFNRLARHHVKLYRPIYTSDSLGGQEVSWEVLDEVWAIVEPKDSKEIIKYENLKNQTVYDITIRRLEALTEQCELELNGQRLDIISLESYDRYLTQEGRHYQVLECRLTQ